VQVTVREGSVAAVVDQATSAPVADQFASLFPTVQGLFDLIQQAERQGADVITVVYHPSLGYPERIHIDYREDMVDEEIGFTVTGFEPIG
jgi:hypothetical protein